MQQCSTNVIERVDPVAPVLVDLGKVEGELRCIDETVFVGPLLRFEAARSGWNETVLPQRPFEIVRELGVDRAAALGVLPKEIVRRRIFRAQRHFPPGRGRILVALEFAFNDVRPTKLRHRIPFSMSAAACTVFRRATLFAVAFCLPSICTAISSARVSKISPIGHRFPATSVVVKNSCRPAHE